jgi:hypothetical protein
MVGLCVLSRVLMISLQADIFFTNNLAVYGFRRGRIFFSFSKKNDQLSDGKRFIYFSLVLS